MIDNPLQTLSQSGLLGVTLDDNAPPAANVIYSSLKNGGGTTPPATTTSLGTIQLAGVLTGTATSPQLAAGSVGASQLAPGAVTSSSIAPGSLPATVLVPNSITSAQLAPGSVTGGPGGTIAANTITNTELAPNAVTNAAIANGAVTYSKMQNISQPALLGNSLAPGGPVSEITMGSGLSLTTVPGTLSIDPVTLPQATSSTFGVIKLGGDLAGTGTTATSPIITAASVTYGLGGKLQNASVGNILLGNSTGASGPVVEVPLTVGGGLQFSGGSLGVNLASITGGSPLSVSAGGTGASTIPVGYLRGNGTSPITSVSTIPASDLTPNLVGSVNGNLPTGPGGNVTVLIGNVTTGTSSTPPVIVPANGSIYVVSGGLPADNGRTYISDGTAWNEVTANQASTDARYVQLAGSTMSASAILTFPATGRVVLNQSSFAATDAVTKNYVDAQVAAGAPDATTSAKGIVQLAGDLTGVATAPLIGSNKVTYAKIQQVSQKALLGNQGPGTANVTEIQLDTTTGIDILAGKLSIDSTNLSVPAATAIKLGGIQLAGDIDPSSATAPIIAPNKITYPKIQQSILPNILLGASTSGSNIGEITLGSSFSLTGNVLDFAPIANAKVLGSSQSGTNVTSLSVGSGLGITGSTLGIDTNSVQYSMLVQAPPSKLIGTPSTGSNPGNYGPITLGPGLSMAGSVLAALAIPQLLPLASTQTAALTNVIQAVRINGLAVNVNAGQRVLLEYHLVLQNSVNARGASVFCLDFSSGDFISGTSLGRVSPANASIGTFQDFTETMNTSLSNLSYGAAQQYTTTDVYQKTVLVDYKNNGGSPVSFSISLGKDTTAAGIYSINCFGPDSSVKYQYF